MRKIFSILLIFQAALISSSAYSQEAAPLPPYAVGLKIERLMDRSRYSKPAYDIVNRRQTIGERIRPIQVLIWYPARHDRKKPLEYSDYLSTTVTQYDYHLTRPEFERKRDHIFKQYIGDLTQQEGERALHRTMLAAVDRKPASGRFPVVVFAPGSGGTAQDNAELCEYLAARGYMVLATASSGAYTQGITLDFEGAEAQMLDTEFLIGAAAGLEHADADNVGVVGVSLGATAGLMTAARDARVKAMVALDGAFRYSPELTKDAPYMKPERISAPLLYIAATENENTESRNDLDAEVADSWLATLVYGDTFLLKMNPMKHYYFNGTVLHQLPASDFDRFKKNDVLQAYGWVEKYTQCFFDAYLKGNATAKSFIRNDPLANGMPTGWSLLQSRTGKGPAPTLEELASIGDRDGFEHLENAYQRLKSRNPSFIPSENALHYWGHDVLDAGRTAQAIEIFKLDVSLHPNEAWPYFGLGQAYEQAKAFDLALDNYRMALDKMPNNDDVQAAIERISKHD